MKRIFIGIKIPLSTKAAELMYDVKQELKDEKIKWVEKQNLHLTLFFLGNTDESYIDKISNQLTKSLAGIKSFNLKMEGLGVFKNSLNPKTVWFGIRNSENLINLKNAVDSAMSLFGFLFEGSHFKPHVTVGRVKFVKNRKRFKTMIEKYSNAEIQELEINEVIFYESVLKPQGPVYEILKEFPLS